MSSIRALGKIPRALSTIKAFRRFNPPLTRRHFVGETWVELMVPKSTYIDKEVQKTVLQVDQSKDTDKTVPVVDVAKQAVAMDKTIIEKLPPTLKKFTLEGKVAIITG